MHANVYIESNTTCLSLGPSDHSFVGEDHLETVFGALSRCGIHVRMMQNSAVKFDLVFDTDEKKLLRLKNLLGDDFLIEVEKDLELLIVRHGNKALVDKLCGVKKVLMEQVNAPTIRRLLS